MNHIERDHLSTAVSMANAPQTNRGGPGAGEGDAGIATSNQRRGQPCNLPGRAITTVDSCDISVNETADLEIEEDQLQPFLGPSWARGQFQERTA